MAYLYEVTKVGEMKFTGVSKLRITQDFIIHMDLDQNCNLVEGDGCYNMYAGALNKIILGTLQDDEIDKHSMKYKIKRHNDTKKVSDWLGKFEYHTLIHFIDI
jgi:hypothetical protein